jgi:hypothetical protein
MTEFQDASISLLRDQSTGTDILNPDGGLVRAGAEYTIGLDYAVRQSGKIIGYCPINFSGDSVHKTEGWGTVLVSGGFREDNAWQ